MPQEPTYIAQDDSELNVIFIHSKLDEIGLSANQFRVFAHLSRRAHSSGKAWPGIDSMADVCRMHKETVIEALRELEERRMIVVERSPGKRSVYRLTAPSRWAPVGNGERSEMGNAPVGNGERNQSEPGNVRKSNEGNPKKKVADAPGKSESSIESKEVVIPDALSSDEFVAAFEEWVENRRKQRIKPYTVKGATGLLAELAAMGQDRAIAAIKHSIARGYHGIYEAKSTNNRSQDRNAGTFNTNGAAKLNGVERLAESVEADA